MQDTGKLLSRRAALGFLAAGAATLVTPASAASRPLVTVHKDPGCGCCTGWVEHVRAAGFPVTVIETRDVDAVKRRLGVPADLVSCHTAQVAGYIVEGHVPASAIDRLLAGQSAALGLAVPGMPIGSPGMEGGTPEIYEVFLFDRNGRSSFGRFKGASPI